MAEVMDSALQAEAQNEVLDLSCIRHLLANKMPTGEGRGFMRKGVTFCSFLPMRSIPFAMICLVGMNEQDFPRRDRRPDFDLMARSPRLGDRSLVTDDRYLFLESLISARKYLYISYVGQSIKDNSPLPPSTVVSELLDYVDANYRLVGVSPPQKTSQKLITVHRLQAFHPSYYQDGPLFSYDRHNLRAARNLNQNHPVPSRCDRPLPDLGPDDLSISLQDLHSFLSAPAAAFCRRRLGMFFAHDEPLSDQEPLKEITDNLKKHQVKDELLGMVIHNGLCMDSVHDVLSARNILPPGMIGRQCLEDMVNSVLPLATQVRSDLAATQERSDQQIQLRLGPFTLDGTFSNLYQNGLYRYTVSNTKNKGRHRLRLWLDHLVLCAVSPNGVICQSRVRSNDECIQFSPIDQQTARILLTGLLRMWRAGMRRPIPFFPEASFIYVWKFLKTNASHTQAFQAAWSSWYDQLAKGYEFEKFKKILEFCFGSKSPLESRAFKAWSLRIYHPMLTLGN